MSNSGPGVMREDWDRRARDDYKLHIATGHSGSDEAFRASGTKDLDDVILDGVHLAPDAETLEIGCGVGRLLVPLSERVGIAHGVDIAPTMIEHARTFCASRGNVRTSVTDGTLEGFADGSLDFVYSFIVFQHIPFVEAIRTYVREAARVLRPGGLFRFQVDGRRLAAGRRPDTYAGVTFEPEAARDLLRETDLEVVEEWGAVTHYHRLTTRKRSLESRAGAALAPFAWDRLLLGDLLTRECGDGARRSDEVVAGTLPLKTALRNLEERLTTAPDAEFVRRAFRALLLRDPDAEGLAFHDSVLRGGFEGRGALLDTFLTSSEFRGLLRPWLHDVPVHQRVRLAEGGAPDAATAALMGIADFVAGRLEGLPPGDAVGEAYRLLLGRRPDGPELAFHSRLVDLSPMWRRLLVRQVLWSGEWSREVKSPGPWATAAIRERLGLPMGDADPVRAVLATLLDRGRAQAHPEFVASAYPALLGREADAEGAAWHTARLVNHQVDRVGFLCDLLGALEPG